MDKDLGIKVTVTRLRRRLSVESEESNSPPAPSTPTKKRGGRLAAKPQLELIDEDANESVPKRTPRKSIARDVVEPEEKVMTPARRSTRIRSNTSLLAEAVTPKVTDSPRAKRAARRNSQLGSDNETPVAAPIRQTRRTRKDSTTSVEIIENDNQTPVAKQTKKNTKNSTPSANEKVTDAATEKESNNDTKSNENGDESSPTIRKSPRLKDKLEKKTPTNKDGNNKGDSSIQLSEEATQSAEIVNNVTPEQDKLDVASKIPLSLDEESVTSTADSNTINSNIKENEASKNITLPAIITNDKIQIDNNSTKEDESAINNTKLSKSKHDIKEEKLNISSEQYDKSDVEKLLEIDPRNMQSVVTIDDSDSNSGKLVMDLPHEGEDQCVPVVHSNHLVNDAPKTFDEPEPMEIDESIPINVTLNDFEQFVESNTDIINQTTELPKNDSFKLKGTAKDNAFNQSLNKSKNTSSISVPSEDIINEVNDSKSKRKSSVSISLESCFQNNDIDALNKSNLNKRRISNSEINSSTSNKSSQDQSSPESNKENLTLNEKLQKSRKSSIRCTDNENNSPANINKSNGKSSISLSATSKVNSPKTYENKNKSRNSSRHSITAENTESENQADKSKIKEGAQDSKSLINVDDNSLNESRNKNKSSATVAQAATQNLERSTNENKSTLVLSQLKDISTNDIKNASKSPDESNNELSKSATVTDIAKNAKNNIINVLTSTPLQQKSMQKLGMQINSSMISPNAGNKSLDIKTNKSTSSVVESSDEEDDVKNKSKMIDDEASEASEDYESGDSRGDDERQYEIENEIVEKGETLESEHDFSNDSDYEKDSFVVSSDAEDDEMLSGTGNDLSLSDTELNMSKKSKKKFNERKRREQKKASREMFEARHNLDKSNNDKSEKLKSKKKAKQLESSESENEIEKPKKKNRMRIDSSHDASVLNSDADEYIGHIKKKTKRLSVSVCEDNVNEKEITICNENVSNKNDPLAGAIKLEPKTPQKNFNISIIPINDKIEEVEVGDMTVINTNETSDPLQTTMAQDEDSLISENAEIVQNYDSVLKNLNDQRKVKTFDMSLNIENKPMAKSKEPIIDQLNLTQTKKDKTNKAVNKSLSVKEKSTDTNKNVSKFIQDEESSDSIDMELLFPEDSNDSEVNKINQDENTVKPAEEFIPLKKTEGKMHIPETMSPSTKLNNSKLNKSQSKKDKESSQADAGDSTPTTKLNNSKLNKSKSKKDKESSQADAGDSTPTTKLNNSKLNKSKSKKEKESSRVDAGDSSEPTESLKFFVDVTGDLDLSHSKKKNKKKYFDEEKEIDPKQSNSNVGENDVQNLTANDEAPMEVSFKSDKKKKKKHKHLNTSANESIVIDADLNSEAERREAEIINKDEIDNKVTELDQSLNTSVKSNKKKKEDKNLNVSKRENETPSTKKKSRKSSEKLIDDNVDMNMGMEVTETMPETSFTTGKKKQKNKHNTSLTDTNRDDTQDFKVTEQTSSDNNQVTEQNPKNLDILFNTEKKKKKKHRNSDVTLGDQSLRLGELFDNKTEEQIEDKTENTNNDTSLKSEKKKKKKHDSKDLVQNEQNVQSNEQETTSLVPEVVTSAKKKKKRKAKDTPTQAEDSDGAPEEISFKFEKATSEEIKEQKTKKRKLEAEEAQGAVQESKSKKKKRKLSDKVENPGDQVDKNVTQKASKKRKRQDGEMELEEKKAKVSKEHSLDKIHIPHLPISLLDQLDDEPPVPKKRGKAIATSTFVVEDARTRKNKPSSYLEQSVYLNDTPKKTKKKQKVKRNPVLPFMPTVETSDQGFTSNFRINVVSETPFVASNTGNFKTDYLAKQRIKKMGSFERFKTQRNHKLCKF